MDPESLRLAMARPGAGEGEGAQLRRRGASREQLEAAREAKRAKSAKAKAEGSSTSIDSDRAKIAALCVLGCGEVLSGDSKAAASAVGIRKGDVPFDAMLKLALSPKVRGSGL